MTPNSHSKEEGKIIVRVDPDLEDLIPGFLENRRKDVQSLQGALERGDYETIRVLGHSMKGAGGGYGFDGITDIGRFLEESAKNEDAQEIKNRITELSNYLERIEIIIEGPSN